MSRPGYHGDQVLLINFTECCGAFVADTLLHSMATASSEQKYILMLFHCFGVEKGAEIMSSVCSSSFYLAEVTGV